MSGREACEKVTARAYKHYVKTTGRLPDSKTTRNIEERVRRAAERVEAKKRAAKR